VWDKNKVAHSIEEGGDSSGRRFHGTESCLVYVYYRFGVKLIQRFNSDDFGSGAMFLRGTCMKTFRLSSTMSYRF
jgi:hypothetical protein